MDLPYLVPGDMLACKGNSFVSKVIMEESAYSHVAMVASSAPVVIAESTASSDVEDLDGSIRVGVQAHFITDWLKAYDGEVWLYPLLPALLNEQMQAYLCEFLQNERRKRVGYDYIGVMKLGLKLMTRVGRMPTEDAGAVFCSELVTMAYQYVGAIDSKLDPAQMTPEDCTKFPLFGPARKIK